MRDLMLASLDEHSKLSSLMNELEEMFLTFVVLPGSQLRMVTRRRRFLEREYNRIRDGIEQGSYLSPEEIDHDIRQTLRHAEVAYSHNIEETDESLKAMRPGVLLEPIEADAVIDDTEQQDLVREFKRIVMPRVHPDTSDAPFEVFDTVYKAYEKRDYLLMEAFIIEYRGEIVQPPGGDPIAFFDLVGSYSRRYRSVLERLQRRVEKLRQDMATQDMEDPSRVRGRLMRHNKEIRKAMYEESETIISLRGCLEDLGRSQSWPQQEGR